MKIMLKRIVFSALIVFSIISIISLAYNYCVVKEAMSQLNLNTQTEGIHQEIINLQNNMNINKLLKMNYYNGMFNILYQLLNILVISLFVGTIIGLILSTKESSIAKYILFFILGNSLCNIFIGIFIQGIYLENEVKLTFFEAYFKSFTSTIIIYSILFTIAIIIKLVNNKIKIDKLNKLCKEKEKN